MIDIAFGRQVCGSLEAAASREWLVADGLGGFAMGTVAGLRTRRYHGLLVVAGDPPIGRHLGLASLDPVLVLGDRRVPLAIHEWSGGVVDPSGFVHLESFQLRSGVPTWRFSVGDVVLEREVAMVHGRPAVAVVHRLVRAAGPVRLELEAICTWRDVHGERSAFGEPALERTGDGFVFEGAYRVRGPNFEPGGSWYHGVRHREEAARGLNDTEDLVFAGRFMVELDPGDTVEVEAWAGDLAEPPADAVEVVAAARRRAGQIVAAARPADDVGATLALAADQFIVTGPTVVAGYPWFGDWSRDTMTSYEGLLLATGRAGEGAVLLERAAASLSEGMLANTADAGGTEYNTVDGTLWFLHALDRHVAATGDLDLAARLLPDLDGIVASHLAGTRFGIGVDPADGLLTQGAPAWCGPAHRSSRRSACAHSTRPTRAISPATGAGRPSGTGPTQGTVWPWLIGPYVEAALRTGLDVAGVADGLVAHLAEWGLGSVSETADGDAPHGATGCPFQAWSLAELLRARRLARGAGAS